MGYGQQSFLLKLLYILVIVLLALTIYYLINIGNKFVSDKRKLKINTQKLILSVIGLIFIFFIYSIFKRYSIIRDTSFTIIFSAILAYIFNPIINYLEKKNIKRFLAVSILYVIILAAILILAFLVIPRSGAEIRNLIDSLPTYVDNYYALIDKLYNKYYSALGDLPPLFKGVKEIFMQSIVKLEYLAMDGVKLFMAGVINTFSKVISLILIPILTYYFLVDKDYFKEKLLKLVPDRWRTKYKSDLTWIFSRIDYSLSKFVRGKVILALSVGFTTTVFLWMFGVDFAIVIGIITTLGDIIPYIGPFLGFVPAVFFAYLVSPMTAIWISLIFIIIQWAANNILAPKIIGDTTGIHPLMVLISIIIGGGVFGVLGMIFAVPVVSIVLILIEFVSKKIKKEI